MKSLASLTTNLTKVFTASALLCVSIFGHAVEAIPASTSTELIDDFEDSTNTSRGFPRIFISDTSTGGSSSTKQSLLNGLMQVKGKIIPPRGQPGWSSSVFPLAQMGEGLDASQFKGLILKIKVNTGNLMLSANSTEITNFDYHTAALIVPSDQNFHKIKIPFNTMKRLWSEQTVLNTKTLNSISLVVASPLEAEYDFVIDDIGFY